MSINLPAARSFMAAHARTLDRRRLEVFMDATEPQAALSALDGYRNPDGGYGWGLEPDLRAAESQPGAALHAFEVFHEVLPTTTSRTIELCDWLSSVSLEDGGLPFALPVADTAGLAPFWMQADPRLSSLQITAMVAAMAHRAAVSHAWLQRATRFCLDRIAQLDRPPHALELMASVWLLDAAHDRQPEAAGLLDRLRRFVPESGQLHVEGGKADESVRPLDLAPAPASPARALFGPDVIAADLERLMGEQQDDGGWSVDFASYSPAAALEWRGYMTVRAVTILRRNGCI